MVVQAEAINLVEETPFRWRIEPEGQMSVPGIVFASRSLLPDVISDRSLHQVADVATLPGIVEASYAMPDVHWGYGFPIGGVAATDVARGGVVSPGGVGFDISCGEGHGSRSSVAAAPARTSTIARTMGSSLTRIRHTSANMLAGVASSRWEALVRATISWRFRWWTPSMTRRRHPGSVSHVMAGVSDGGAFHSTCHGAGRTMSRQG